MQARFAFAVAVMLVSMLTGVACGSPTLVLKAETDGTPGRASGCWIDAFGFQHCRPAIPGKPGMTLQASAVCIGRSNDSCVCITAAHTFRNRPPRVYVIHEGKSLAAYDVRICERYDFAAFEIRFDASIDCASLLYEAPLGTEATAEGWGAGRYRSINGTIDRRWFQDVATGMQLGGFSSAEPIIAGDSGGGVFTRSGELVGVIIRSDLQGRSSFVPLKHCQAFLRRHYPDLQCGGGSGPALVRDPEPEPEPIVGPAPRTIAIDYERLADLVVKRMQENPEPFRGPPGRDGAAGRDGKDGTSPAIDYGQLAESVRERLPPLRVVFDGPEPVTVEVPVGSELVLPPVKLQLQDEAGGVHTREGRLGGPPLAIGFESE